MKQTHYIKTSAMLFLVVFLTSCGFHTPYKNNAINFNISGESDFIKIVQRKLDKNIAKTLTVKINTITQNKTNEVISSANVLKYDLELAIDFSVYNAQKVIFTNTLTTSRYLNNIDNNATSYQEQKAYKDMQHELAEKIIRKVSRL